jgi:hypothetical protein
MNIKIKWISRRHKDLPKKEKKKYGIDWNK